jgi:thioredoxin-related protein
MKTLFAVVLIILPTFLAAQEKGILFLKTDGWQQTLARAKENGKIIFVDCYASWCLPCKQMDNEVYSRDSIGKYANGNFISIKLQLDTSKNDDEHIKMWYKDAHEFLVKYQIKTVPTYLFFLPNGNLVHKAVGAKSEEDFMKLLNAALRPETQYYSLIDDYQNGRLDLSLMPQLAKIAKQCEDTSLAWIIAKDWLNNCLLKAQRPEEVIKRQYIEFVTSFPEIIKLNDLAFTFLSNHSKQINATMKDSNFTERFIDHVISRDVILPFVNVTKKGQNPNWKYLVKTISRRCGATCAERNVLSAKVMWYRKNKNWEKYTQAIVLKYEKYDYGKDSIWVPVILNNNAWEIFQYSFNKRELEKALSWSERSVKFSSFKYVDPVDTWANILYKLGRNEEALALEKIAVDLSPENKAIVENFEKMKAGIPTWPSLAELNE